MRLLPIFEIELVECLYVITRECDRNKHNTLLAEARETLERVHRLWAHPRAWPDLRLPYKAVGIRVSQAIHHSRNGRGDLENIWVAVVTTDIGSEWAEKRSTALLCFSSNFWRANFDILGDSLI
jgi:hypothetical protein